MTCLDIFKSALRLLNEIGDEDNNGDYAERAPYILSSMFSNAASIDKKYRAANGLEEQPAFSPVYTELTADFPLCDRFASSAAFYLASLLIIDANEQLSDSFFERFCDGMAAISAEIPSASPTMWSLEGTKNVY